MLNVNPDKIGIERYRMPSVKIQSRKNNKTYIININEIAKALDRGPEELLRFIGLTLSTQVNSGDFSVNGVYTVTKVQETVYKYISSYVLCNVCANPETQLFISKSKKLKRGCKACGASNDVLNNARFDKWLFTKYSSKPSKPSKKKKSKKKKKKF